MLLEDSSPLTGCWCGCLGASIGPQLPARLQVVALAPLHLFVSRQPSLPRVEVLNGAGWPHQLSLPVLLTVEVNLVIHRAGLAVTIHVDVERLMFLVEVLDADIDGADGVVALGGRGQSASAHHRVAEHHLDTQGLVIINTPG